MVAVGVTMASLGVGSDPVWAQTGSSPPRIEVIDQSAAVGPGETFSLQLRVDGLDLEDLAIEVTLHESFLSIEGLDQEPGGVIAHYEARPLVDFLVEQAGLVTLRIPTSATDTAESSEPASTAGRPGSGITEVETRSGLVVADAGVYPMVITVTAMNQDSDATSTGPDRGPETEATTLTTFVRHPGPSMPSDGLPARAPTPVIVLLDVGLDPAHEGGAGALSVEEATEILGQRLELEATVFIRRTAMERLQGDPELAARFSDAVAGRSVVAEPLYELDPSALATIGQWRLYRRAAQRTAAELVELGLSPEPTMAVVSSPLTEPATVALMADGFTAVIDTTAVIVGGVGPIAVPTPSDPVRMSTVAGDLLVVAVNGAPSTVSLASTVDRGRSLGRDGHRQLAELILAETDLAVIRPGVGVAGTAGPVLEALQTTPWFRPVTLADGLAGVAVELRSPMARSLQDLSALAEPLGEADRLLATYSSFYVDGPHAPSDYLLALSDATTVEADASTRAVAVEAVSTELREAMEVVSLPGDQSVTLAARSASIPLTIENSSNGTRQVQLQFRADRLEVTDDQITISVPPGSSVHNIEVEARSLGTSPLAIAVVTPDGQRSLASTRFQVRSTAVPGLGLLLSIGGLSMLGLWWYLSIRRNRANPTSRTGSHNYGPADEGVSESLDLRPRIPPNPDAVTAGDSVGA
ncbi:MAG: hypothetical protein GY939_16355 [Actinomycetia bacterium]|nr:hypothetical protein [Actinomycetes bacterium]